ncbi:DUF1707 domain-containing protein [Pseudonocardia kunmingensis]|uniref:TM2 domain-containing protein n=1 Tax=Pseudonocardia kunmingensis TaxID=630975 RepID=A0A543DVX0_9PSEU|nr:DUF1707 domain-containing protein [Pseudonocardia kunmingensis]TQM13454.1 TM2 domain-containing protein [Pseudonocardia kunmingensis]
MSTPETRGIRIGHDEREAAVRELGEHFSEGRLDPQEYEERMSAAYAARTTDDLAPLFADLPRPHDAATMAVPQGSTSRWPAEQGRSWQGPVASAGALEPGPDAPYGRDPDTLQPYSEKNKVVAGVLQLVLPFGVGRFYTGHVATGVAQLLLSFIGIGVIWAFIDGIVLLAGSPRDPRGRPLRP